MTVPEEQLLLEIHQLIQKVYPNVGRPDQTRESRADLVKAVRLIDRLLEPNPT